MSMSVRTTAKSVEPSSMAAALALALSKGTTRRRRVSRSRAITPATAVMS